jgi:anti-sigma B factor antagonist
MEIGVMKLVEDIAGDIAIVEAHGRVDNATARVFGDRLIALIHAGHFRMVVDLKNVAYVSSTGFRALILADRATEHRQGKLALCEVNGDVRRLFEIGAFLDVFLICPTREDAVAKLRQLYFGYFPAQNKGTARCEYGEKVCAHFAWPLGHDGDRDVGADSMFTQFIAATGPLVESAVGQLVADGPANRIRGTRGLGGKAFMYALP